MSVCLFVSVAGWLAGELHLTPVNRFCYLGSYLSNTISVDIDINSRFAKAGDAFGKLQRRLWGEHSVALLTKVAVYQAVVLSTLLYGCESWVLYRRSVRRLDEFHVRCLRKIPSIKWQDRLSNKEVLRLCGSSGIEAYFLAAQLRWVGHVVRMEDDRIPKPDSCRQANAHSVVLLGVTRTNMKRCGLRPQSLSTAPFDRAQWRTTCQSATALFEESRVAELDRKRAARKQQVINTTGTVWPHDRCSRTCSSQIGLFTRRRTHR